MSRFSRNIRHIAVLLPVVAFAAGCPHEPTVRPKVKTSTVRVRSYTEATQVTHVAGLQPYAFTATMRGLDRWDMRTGKGLLLTADHGLPGDKVLATALDRGRGWLWVATNGGVTRYDVENGVFTGIPPAPTDALSELVRATRALAPAGTGGVWLGSADGLAYADDTGNWQAADFTHPINALERDRAGNLWIGTADKGLAVRRPDGRFESLGGDPHCVVRTVRFVVVAADGAAVAVGEDAAGQQRISIVSDGVCASYRPSPDGAWIGATRLRDEIIVMTRRRFYALSVSRPGARRLQREGMHLVPLAVGTDTVRGRSPYRVRSLDTRVPFGANSIAATSDTLLVGTIDQGTAIIDPSLDDVTWLRRGELAGAGETISVACLDRKQCYVATGGNALWRFDGATFQHAGGDDTVVLAVASGSRGGAYALYRISDEPRVRVARVDGEQWQELETLEVLTPGRRASLAFAKTSPRGMLWIGLQYEDEDGELRPYGAAEIDLGLGLVAYHHASRDETEAERGVLPIPIDVTEVDFHGQDEIWLASTEGVVRVQGQELRVYMESEGLVSELVRGVAVTSGGVVFAATGAGVGVYDGEHWSAPAPLRRATNAVTVGPDGRLWMATPRGVAAFDGARVRRLDKRRGLLEDKITDIQIDRFGRIWALGRQGISVIMP